MESECLLGLTLVFAYEIKECYKLEVSDQNCTKEPLKLLFISSLLTLLSFVVVIRNLYYTKTKILNRY